MADYPTYRYSMGFKIGSTSIPDPHVFTGAVSDLDTLGKRDATGYLHRNRVATKHPIKLEYHGIPWSLIQTICSLMTADKFSFTFPDPALGGSTRTVQAYVGDREWEVTKAVSGETYLGDLKFSVIQY